jgi:two-component system, chemotaxis family, CheB/CheR fusion protein
VTPERLRRFFAKEDNGYRVNKEIREMVVFAVQSVVKDPPFTRLDLLACRNLLIYLEPELQNRLIPAFHYALKPGGVLFLSPSESIGAHTELFEPIDRKWKLYRAKPSAASIRTVLGSGLSWAAGSGLTAPSTRHRPAEPHYAELAKRALLQSFAPAAVVTDLQGDILYVHGETGKFLRPAPGQPTHNVIEMARDGLQLVLREALRHAGDEGWPAQSRTLSVRNDGQMQAVNLGVRALPDPDASHRVLLISFQEVADAAVARAARRPRAGSTAEAQRIADLERELAYATESMKAMLEEQQASNEELKSTNEELQSTNEELQSSNEELETSKEELQSVNEELVTVNAELQAKIEQNDGHAGRHEEPARQHPHRHDLPRPPAADPALHARCIQGLPPGSHRHRPAAGRHSQRASGRRPAGRRAGGARVVGADRARAGDGGRHLVPRAHPALPHGGQPHRRCGADLRRCHRARIGDRHAQGT